MGCCGNVDMDRLGIGVAIAIAIAVLIIAIYFALGMFTTKEYIIKQGNQEFVIKRGMTKQVVEGIIGKKIYTISTPFKGWKTAAVTLDNKSYSVNFKKGKLVDIKFHREVDEDELF